MSETMIAKGHEHREHKEKDKEPKGRTKDQDYDPYCCTPPDGDGGPDTKP